MTEYHVEFTAAAAKQIRKLSEPTRRRLILAIAGLEADPGPQGVKKLVGESNTWRIRVGDYRVIYEIADSELLILIFRAAHRREVY